MARKSKVTAPVVALTVGDHVLLGGTRASYPGEWYLGTILWTDGAEILIQRYTMNGQKYTQMASALEVRATGTIAELTAIQNAARDGVRAFRIAVEEATSALGRARDALWARLEDLAKGGLAAIPPDFDAMKAEQDAERAIIEVAESEMTVEPAP